MRLRINNFLLTISFPALAIAAFVVINSNFSNYFLCFIAIIIHEIGHLFVMKLLGLSPKGIEIKAFNIKIIESSRYNTSFSKDIAVILAGPLLEAKSI